MVLATKKNCQRVLAASLRLVSAMTGNPPLVTCSHMQEQLQNASSQQENSKDQYIYKTAIILREEIEGRTYSNAIKCFKYFSRESEINRTQKASSINAATMSQKRLETEGSLPEVIPQDENEERSCLSISEDAIHCNSNEKKMPKP